MLWLSAILLLYLLPLILCAEDYYKLLSIDKSASDKEIKRAYRTLSKKFHPDKNPCAYPSASIFLSPQKLAELTSSTEATRPRRRNSSKSPKPTTPSPAPKPGASTTNTGTKDSLSTSKEATNSTMIPSTSSHVSSAAAGISVTGPGSGGAQTWRSRCTSR